MSLQIISERPDLMIRRLTLQPGECTPWHVDPCHRFTVVVRGEHLTIEFEESGDAVTVAVYPGLAGWDEPDPRVHRAVNTGTGAYEEVVTFYRNRPDEDPQPRRDGGAP